MTYELVVVDICDAGDIMFLAALMTLVLLLMLVVVVVVTMADKVLKEDHANGYGGSWRVSCGNECTDDHAYRSTLVLGGSDHG